MIICRLARSGSQRILRLGCVLACIAILGAYPACGQQSEGNDAPSLQEATQSPRIVSQDSSDPNENAETSRDAEVSQDQDARTSGDTENSQDVKTSGDTETSGDAKSTESPEFWNSSAAIAGASREGAETSGRLRFDFAAAKWDEVLAWFAGAAQMNLNWQELPDGELNLITRGSYDVAEARNVLNMHLLARGFTLLQRDEVLFLVRLGESLNPTMVPRVLPEELDERGSHEYVRVSLPLEWMLAEEAARELSPLLSPHGNIVPLTSTNRIEAMDAVTNLRELRDLLTREQSLDGQDRLVAEFPLRHAEAVEVIEKLKELLGLEAPRTRMSRDEMRLARDEMVLQTEMVKRLGDKAPKLAKQGHEVHLVANERQNSILANAAPDKIAVIRQAVQALDVPMEDQEVRLTDITTMKVYPLNGADADSVASILDDLRDIGKLETSCRFSEDDDRQTLFAHASLQDHLTIKSVMEQLAGSARSLQVIPLQQLQAEYVAASILAMMQGVGASDRDRRNRWRRGPTGQRGFRIEADVPGNRLFVYATTAESQHVDEFLVKLGERPARDENQRTVAISVDNIAETIEHVRDLWPSLSNQPLHVDVPGGRADSDDVPENRPTRRRLMEPGEDVRTDSAEPLSDEAPREAAAHRQDHTAVTSSRESWDEGEIPSHLHTSPALREVSLVTVSDSVDFPAVDTAHSEARSTSRPNNVLVRTGGSGELILRSDDRQALDQLENLVRGTLPRTRPYTVFQLEHASPFLVELTLQDIFTSDGIRAVKPLRFVSDSNTRTLMVFGAGEPELREIEKLLEFYDQPPESDPETVRKPRYFELEYADVEEVAMVIKDLYRDLLSANDRALAEQRGQRAQDSRSSMPIVPSDDKTLQFKGILSVGTYSDTNTLIVSAPQYLTDEIEETIRELDREEAAAATGTVTSVVRVGGDVNGTLIAERLDKMMSEPPSRQDERQVRRDPRGDRSNAEQRVIRRGDAREDLRRLRGPAGQRNVPLRGIR